MPKTNAEMCRQYRRKKNENKIKIKKNPGKSSTERCREFRARKKQLLNNQNRCSNISVNVTDVINDHSQQQNSVPTGYNLVNNDYNPPVDVQPEIQKRTKNMESSDSDRFKRRLIRSVATSISNNVSGLDLWKNIQESTGCDCTVLWQRMRCLAISRVQRLLPSNDVTDQIPPVARMTRTDWLMYDLILVHEKIDVIHVNSISEDCSPQPLLDLIDLVAKYEIETEQEVDALPRLWLRLATEYNTNGRYCSAMLLQKRWYQLKQATRKRFYMFWFTNHNHFTSAKKIPSPLYVLTAAKFPRFISSPLTRWHELVKNKTVVLPSVFESIVNTNDIDKAATDLVDPTECVILEQKIDVINLDDENDTPNEEEGSNTKHISDITDGKEKLLEGDTLKTEDEYSKMVNVKSEPMETDDQVAEGIHPELESTDCLSRIQIVATTHVEQVDEALSEQNHGLGEEVSTVKVKKEVAEVHHEDDNIQSVEEIESKFSESKNNKTVEVVLTPIAKNKIEDVLHKESEMELLDAKLDNIPLNIEHVAADVNEPRQDSDCIEYVNDGIEFTDNDSPDDCKSSTNDKGSNGTFFDKKLTLTPIAYTKKLDNMKVLKGIFKSQMNVKDIIDEIISESKPGYEARESGTTDNDAEEDEDCDRISLTSPLLQKPEHRVYNPIMLCKNPDFNTRLKRLGIGFLTVPNNLLLLKECRPITVDVHKAFEGKLVDGVLRLRDDIPVERPASVEPPVCVSQPISAVGVSFDDSRKEITDFIIAKTKPKQKLPKLKLQKQERPPWFTNRGKQIHMIDEDVLLAEDTVDKMLNFFNGRLGIDKAAIQSYNMLRKKAKRMRNEKARKQTMGGAVKKKNTRQSLETTQTEQSLETTQTEQPLQTTQTEQPLQTTQIEQSLQTTQTEQPLQATQTDQPPQTTRTQPIIQMPQTSQIMQIPQMIQIIQIPETLQTTNPSQTPQMIQPAQFIVAIQAPQTDKQVTDNIMYAALPVVRAEPFELPRETPEQHDITILRYVLSVDRLSAVSYWNSKKHCCWMRQKMRWLLLRKNGITLSGMPPHTCLKEYACTCCCANDYNGFEPTRFKKQKRTVKKIVTPDPISNRLIEIKPLKRSAPEPTWPNKRAVTNVPKEISANATFPKPYIQISPHPSATKTKVEFTQNKNSISSKNEKMIDATWLESPHSQSLGMKTVSESKSEASFVIRPLRKGKKALYVGAKKILLTTANMDEFDKLVLNNVVTGRNSNSLLKNMLGSNANKDVQLESDGSKKSILSDLMEMSGISADDADAESTQNSATDPDSTNTLRLSVICSLTEVKWAVFKKAKFFTLDFNNGIIFSVCIHIKSYQNKLSVNDVIEIDDSDEETGEKRVDKPTPVRFRTSILKRIYASRNDTRDRNMLSILNSKKKDKRKETLEPMMDEEYLLDSDDSMLNFNKNEPEQTIEISSDEEPLSVISKRKRLNEEFKDKGNSIRPNEEVNDKDNSIRPSEDFLDNNPIISIKEFHDDGNSIRPNEEFDQVEESILGI